MRSRQQEPGAADYNRTSAAAPEEKSDAGSSEQEEEDSPQRDEQRGHSASEGQPPERTKKGEQQPARAYEVRTRLIEWHHNRGDVCASY